MRPRTIESVPSYPLALATTALLVATAGTCVFAAFLDAPDSAADDFGEPAGDEQGGTTKILFLALYHWQALGLLVTTAAVFCVWLYRANRDARALGAREMRFSPRASVAWWFVPIAHLFKPYQVMTELWRASDPERRRDWATAPKTSALPAWWARIHTRLTAKAQRRAVRRESRNRA